MGSIAWKRECREDNEESTMTKASRTENRLTRLGTCVAEDSRLKPETRLSQIDFRIRQSARMPSSVVTDEGFSQISFSHFPLFPSFWESAQCSATCTAQTPAERSMKCGADGCVWTFHSGRLDCFHYSPLLVPPTPRVYSSQLLFSSKRSKQLKSNRLWWCFLGPRDLRGEERRRNTWARQEMKTSNNSETSFFLYFWETSRSKTFFLDSQFQRKCNVANRFNSAW